MNHRSGQWGQEKQRMRSLHPEEQEIISSSIENLELYSRSEVMPRNSHSIVSKLLATLGYKQKHCKRADYWSTRPTMLLVAPANIYNQLTRASFTASAATPADFWPSVASSTFSWISGRRILSSSISFLSSGRAWGPSALSSSSCSFSAS